MPCLLEFGIFNFGILHLESPNLELTSIFKLIKMNTHKLITIVVLCLGLSNVALASHHKMQRDQITNEYEINDGMLTGHFVSYYENGKKQADGNFSQNNRVGHWTFYNEAGEAVEYRTYTNNYQFKHVDKFGNEEVLMFNKNGVWDMIQEKNVWFKERLYRTIFTENNPLFFQEQGIFSTLKENFIQGKMVLYTDFRFVEPLTIKQFPTISNQEIIGYKFKEDHIIDSENKMLNHRAIGICPLAIQKNTKDTIELFWAYYPDCRKALQSTTLTNKALPKNIQTYDDLIAQQYYANSIFSDIEFGHKQTPIIYYKSILKNLDIYMIAKENEYIIQYL